MHTGAGDERVGVGGWEKIDLELNALLKRHNKHSQDMLVGSYAELCHGAPYLLAETYQQRTAQAETAQGT